MREEKDEGDVRSEEFLVVDVGEGKGHGGSRLLRCNKNCMLPPNLAGIEGRNINRH